MTTNQIIEDQNHIIDEDALDTEWLEQQQPAAFDAADKAEMFDGAESRYPGDLITDCAAVTGGQALREVGQIFADVFGGDGKNKDADRAAKCGGFYETQARGGR